MADGDGDEDRSGSRFSIWPPDSFQGAATLVFLGAAFILFVSAPLVVVMSSLIDVWQPASNVRNSSSSATTLVMFRVLGLVGVVFFSSGVFVLVARTGLPRIGRALIGVLDLQKAGLLAFIIASVAVILACALIVGSSLFGEVTSGGFYVIRSIEILLSLAAAAVVVAIISRDNTESFVVIIGVVALLAFIIPTNEIIRFGLLFSDSDKTYSDLYIQNPPTKTGISPQAEELAEIAVEFLGLEESDKSSRLQLENQFANHLTTQISNEVIRRGAMPLLQSACGDEEDNMIFQFGKLQKFRDHLSYMRNEGLISYPYEDTAQLTITRFGQSVLRAAQLPTGCADLQLEDVRGAGAILLGDTITLEVPARAVRRYQLMLPEGGEFHYAKINGVARSANVDPVVVVRTPDGVETGRSDDDGRGLNAELLVRLDSRGGYSIDIENIGAEGSIELSVQSISSAVYNDILRGRENQAAPSSFLDSHSPVQWVTGVPDETENIVAGRGALTMGLAANGNWFGVASGFEGGAYIITALGREVDNSIVDTQIVLIEQRADGQYFAVGGNDDGNWDLSELAAGVDTLDPKLVAELAPDRKYYLYISPFDETPGDDAKLTVRMLPASP